MLRRIVFLVALIVGVAGCSKNTSTPTRPAAPNMLKLAPADGATAVRLDAPVTVDFGVPVDQRVVERGLHLVSQADMVSLCPDSTMRAHGSMDAVMSDPAMLAHMEALHSIHGQFSWNSAGTVCMFAPDTLMRDQTRYMVHMGHEVLDMMGRMGGTMGSGTMSSAGDMFAHFTTTTADAHAGHH